MDKAATKMEAPTEQPHDEKNGKDSPKHRVTFRATGEWPLRIKSGALERKLSAGIEVLSPELGNRFEPVFYVERHLVDGL